ncbi:MAG: DUF1275 domain-containing protein [Candidatus Nephthysia bennettiae]|uniref:DUF1275 domain-containing protein n=1 Tax=Candidatus Nephthysia bennettiae TaxID=3127016 RepID=A0A934N9U1_9BACT|nr:DUF1275 domain-containing protein [Candidatus Dormibacteraeota bacterium]MBJ7614599.1 DUF1275 domain-containing protein [Candidatus Dormibacteraeota bacterium]PZR98579.1 MAG: DUF1275 domain-containing protein [Candidatus Dormibacteraeota bacterium]
MTITGRIDQGRALQTLLLVLTTVSGLVDAVSYLKLGHVFVANMTGNVVFVGFALAGATEVSAVPSLIAIMSFLLAALAAGRLERSMSASPARLLSAAAAVQLAILLVVAAVGVVVSPSTDPARYVMVALLSAAMGIQSATTTRLKVPGFNSTVVLTTMLSTLASNSRLAGGSGAQNGWRIVAVLAMLTGGLAGTLLLFHVAVVAPVGLAAIVVAAVSVSAQLVGRRLA